MPSNKQYKWHLDTGYSLSIFVYSPQTSPPVRRCTCSQPVITVCPKPGIKLLPPGQHHPSSLSAPTSSRIPYAFPLLFPFFPPLAATSVPLAISELAAADSASSISAVYGLSVLVAGRRFGSSLPTAGIAVASMVWKGAGTKWPAASNHSVKERVMVMVSGLEDLDLGGSMVMVRVYSGMFLRVEVAIVTCEGRV